MNKFDKSKPFSEVGGRAPMVYMQNGFGYSRSGECLGAVNSQGELVAASTKPAGDDSGTPPTQAEVYGAMKAPEIQALLTERGIETEKGTKKAGLINLLLADDAAKASDDAQIDPVTGEESSLDE